MFGCINHSSSPSELMNLELTVYIIDKQELKIAKFESYGTWDALNKEPSFVNSCHE